ncbi:MAG: AAA family ATPase [Oscillochloris sp.]|nr:AAA family ATPase [Oscillochloris sp.]
MAPDLLATLAAYIPRDRAAYIFSGHPLSARGIALIADISGFTPLTEGLAQALSAARGAEELTRALNSVFTPLIAAAHAYGGSIVKFGGDALIIWFPQPQHRSTSVMLRRALAAAHAMQAAIAQSGTVHTDAGTYTLTMKIGMAYGPVLRVYLGNVLYGYEDVIGGTTLDRMAEAEHHANAGEVVLDPSGLSDLAQLAPILEQRDEFVLVGPPYNPPRLVPIPLPLFEDSAAALIELRAYVPQEVYTALREGRSQPAELKPVVSIFVQFQGIRYEDGRRAEEQLSAYFGAAQRVAAGYGGRVNRLITGDKGSVLHLIFGAPRALEELELRAARCALELRALPAQMPFITAQRIGMATGRAFAGPVGSSERNDYTVMGDTINLSARLMQRADANQIVIGPTLAARLRSTMAITPLGPTRLKGKAAPVELFALDGVAVQFARPAAQVIGRDNELALLRERLAGLAIGHSGVLLLSGELGMGKTHLLDALRRTADLRWVVAAATDYGGQAGGALIAAALRELLALPAGADYAALEQATTALLGERAGDSAAPYLARLLGITLDERRARELDSLGGESLRWRLSRLVGELTAAALAHGPLVIALDDLQWADPTSLELLGSLLALVPSEPHPSIAQSSLLLILSHRPDVSGRAEALLTRLAASGVTQVKLGAIGPDAARIIVLQHAPDVTAAALEQMIARGAGTPLFLVELARATAASGPDAILPETIEGVLQAQIDRLPGPLRATLQLAAVLGPAGEPRLLRELIATSEAIVVERIAALIGAGFLLGEGEDYRFRHTLIRESAYSALLYVRRREYHGAAAKAIERIFPTQIAERSATIGMHYERAGSFLEAARYHGQAADAARLLDAGEEAEAGYRHVLALLEQAGGGGELRGRTLLKLAQVKMNAGDYMAAQELYDAAFELLDQLEGRAERASQQASVFRMGELEPATLDPGLVSTVHEVALTRELFEGLVTLDGNLGIIPAAARRWQIGEHGRIYRFELRSDLCWSNGTEITAHDFVFAFRRNLDPATNAALATQLYPLVGAEALHSGAVVDPTTIGIQAIDDYTLELQLATAASHFLYVLAAPIAFPQPKHLVEALGSDWSLPEHIVGNGHFVLTAWHRSKYLELRRNTRYRRRYGDVEHVRVEFGNPGDDLMRRDELELIRCVDHPGRIADFPGAIVSVLYLNSFLLSFACGAAPFAERGLRRAFALAIDTEQLVQDVWQGVQLAARGGVVPPGMPGHSPEIGLRFDPAAAREAFAAAGGVNGTIVLGALPGMGATPQFLCDAWYKHLGVTVELAPDVPVEMLLDGLRDGRFQMALFGWDLDFPEPADVLQTLFYSNSPINYFGWRNPQFDQLIDEALALSRPAERLARFHAADRLLVAEEVAAVPLYHSRSYVLLRPGYALAGDTRVVRGGRLSLDQIVRMKMHDT